MLEALIMQSGIVILLMIVGNLLAILSISPLVEWRKYLEDKERKYMGKDLAQSSQNMHDVC